MVLRPILWLGLAYIAGEILVWMNLADPVLCWGIVGSCGSLLGILCLVLRKKICAFTGRTPDKKAADLAVFIGLPVFLLFGALNFQRALDQALAWDVKLEGLMAGELHSSRVFTGTLEKAEEKTNSWYFFVKDCPFVQGQKLLVSINKGDMSCSGSSFVSGDIVTFSGEVELFSHPENEGVFDEWLYYHSRGIRARVWADSVTMIRESGSWLEKGAGRLRLWMKEGCEKYLSPRYAGITLSMVCGDDSLMEDSVEILYQKSGISHILAISGLHVTFLGMGIYGLLRKLSLPNSLCIFVGMGAVLVYGWFTGMAPSTLRAVIMTLLSLGARLLGRSYDIKTGLAAAALWILVPSPLMITQPGFLLSFIAVGSLVLCPSMKVTKKTPASGIKAFLGRLRSGWIRAMLSPMYVTAGMLPVLSWCFCEVSMYSIFINLAVIPLMSLVYPAMLVCALLAPALGNGGFLLYRLIEGVLAVYDVLCQMTMALPQAVVITGKPSPGEMFFSYGMFLAAAGLIRRFIHNGEKIPRRIGCGAGLVFILMGSLMLFLPRHPGKMTVTMINAGQGDCFFIQLPEGKNILVDGGSSDEKNMGTYILEPFLKSRGVRHLDGVFLSHLDEDHVNGIREMMGGAFWNGEDGQRIPGSIRISSIFFPGHVPLTGGHESVLGLAQALGARCYAMWSGETVSFGKLTMTALAPEKEAAAAWETMDKNDGSLVLYMSYQNFSMVFTGDISQKAEESVLASLERLGLKKCHVLKVAHHGSKNSTSDIFLQTVCPDIALISCGRDNSYGHPHRELVERLSRYVKDIYATPWDGSVKVETDGKFIKTVVWSWKDGYNIRQED